MSKGELCSAVSVRQAVPRHVAMSHRVTATTRTEHICGDFHRSSQQVSADHQLRAGAVSSAAWSGSNKAHAIALAFSRMRECMNKRLCGMRSFAEKQSCKATV